MSIKSLGNSYSIPARTTPEFPSVKSAHTFIQKRPHSSVGRALNYGAKNHFNTSIISLGNSYSIPARTTLEFPLRSRLIPLFKTPSRLGRIELRAKNHFQCQSVWPYSILARRPQNFPNRLLLNVPTVRSGGH